MPIQEVVALVDRSGSMAGKEADTVGGINTTINELKASKSEDDTICFSLKLFDHVQILKWRCRNIDEIDEFLLSDFVPRGQTALLDAIGDTLSYFMEKKIRSPLVYDSCLIYVATDGYENASERYKAEDIKSLIKNAEEEYNIRMMYLGANQDAILEASKIGISASRAINYSETAYNVQAVYRSVASAAVRTRSTGETGFLLTERQASSQSPPVAPLTPVANTDYSEPTLIHPIVP
jgi:uncharacterized protein YegL